MNDCFRGIISANLRLKGKTAELRAESLRRQILRLFARFSSKPSSVWVTRYSFEKVKRRSCKQFKEGAALPTEVYTDVHEQGKT